jgi:hypothetical protein
VGTLEDLQVGIRVGIVDMIIGVFEITGELEDPSKGIKVGLMVATNASDGLELGTLDGAVVGTADG